jgi:hypothetical protein
MPEIGLKIKLSTGSWSGIGFHFNQSWNTADYGALTFAVKTDNSDLRIYPYLKQTNGDVILPEIDVRDYVVDGSTNGGWEVVWIPLRDLSPDIANADISDLFFEFSWVGKVWFGEVKVVEKLVWPLPEYRVGNHTVEYLFGVNWLGTGNLHSGVDYSTCETAGKTVVASHSGKVVDLHEDSDSRWGWHVIIQAEGNAFATKYTHVTPTVSLGTHVEAGDPIAVTGDISGPHLHFALRMGLYEKSTDASIMYAGALSPSTFPEAFIDPELVWPANTVNTKASPPEVCSSIVP